MTSTGYLDFGMASQSNIYSLYGISKIIILDIPKRFLDLQKSISDIRNNYFGYPK